MNDPDELLAKSKVGTLSKQEANAIAAELAADPRAPRAYTLLHALGYSGHREARSLVEQFLSYSTNPMLARLALQTVCRYWGEARRYRVALLNALRGFDWDEDDEVR